MIKPPVAFSNTQIELHTQLTIEFLPSLEPYIEQIGKYIYNLWMTGYIVVPESHQWILQNFTEFWVK